MNGDSGVGVAVRFGWRDGMGCRGGGINGWRNEGMEGGGP